MNGTPPYCIQLQQGGVYMVGKYDVTQGGQVIGSVAVTQQGLYYRIACRCSLSGAVICKLAVFWKDRKVDLGIRGPEKDAFALSTRLAVKLAGEGTPEFRVLPKHEPMDAKFTPLRADEPFAYLSQLENAYLRISGGQIGLIIRENEG